MAMTTTSRLSKHAHQVEVAKSISEKLWSMSDTHEAVQGSLDKYGNIIPQSSEKPSHKVDGNFPLELVSLRMGANLLYQRFQKKSATEWLHRLKACSGTKRPSAEQLQFSEGIVKRCVEEAIEEQSHVEYRSEPARLLLHGVPGDYTYVSTLWHINRVKVPRSS